MSYLQLSNAENKNSRTILHESNDKSAEIGKDTGKIIIPFSKDNNANTEDFSVFNTAVNYGTEKKQSSFVNFMLSTGLLITTGIAGLAIFKNIRLSKQLADATSKLAKTTAELNTAKASYAEAEKVIEQVRMIAKEPAKIPVADFLSRIIQSATSGLKLTNEFGAECGKLCDNARRIKGIV